MKNKVHLSTESRIHREVYVRFGGRLSKTCRSNTTRRRVPSLHYIFDVEKKDSIKTLLLTLWKSEDDKVTKTESGELGSAVSAYIERIQSDRSIVPSFNTFYEYMRDDYRKELAQRDIKVERRRSLTSPLSFMMRSNCSQASKNLVVVSLSSSFGMICPRHSVLKLLCIRLRSFVVLVR